MFSYRKYNFGILLALLMLPLMAHATLDADSRLQISATSRVPVIDGELDVVWKNTSRTLMRQFVDNRIDHDEWRDQFAVFRVMYDDDNLYVHVEILDEDKHANDGVEFFFDGDNGKGSGYDADDTHLRWTLGNTTEAFGNAPNSTAEWKNTTYGYNFEARIPKSDLNFEPAEGHVLGFDVGAYDNDDDNIKSHVRWWSDDLQSNTDPSHFGTALFVRRTISDSLDFTKLTPAPVIDGQMDEVWHSVPEIGQGHYVDEYGQTNILAFDDWEDLQMTYRAGWNSTGIYVYVNVIDDVISTSHVNEWRNDGVELYFDGLNEKADGYDSNDVMFRWMYGKTVEEGDDAPNSDVIFTETDDGYVFEAYIPNADLPFTVDENHVLGFEVRVNDNDDTDREGMVQWFTNSTKSSDKASYFGTAILSSQSLDHVTIEPDTFEVDETAGTGAINLTYYGSGTVGWTSGVINGENWIRIISETSGSRSGSVTFEYDANPYAASRTGQIEIRCLGEESLSPKVVQVIQDGMTVETYNKVLAVHGGNSIGEGDQVLLDHLETIGLDVTAIKDVNVSVADTAGMNAVYIFESATSNYVGGMFKSVEIPVIVNEPFIMDDMGMSTSQSQTGNDASDIVITAPDERLAFGFADTIAVYSVNNAILNFATPGPEATVIARAPQNNEAVLFYYQAGDHLTDGSPAKAHRIGFFINGQDGKNLTESGMRLVEASLDWILPGFDLPKVKIVNPWVNDFSGGDKVLNPGEFVQLSFSVQNNRLEALSRIVGVPDRGYDVYVHPDTAYFFDDHLEVNSVITSGSAAAFDALDTYVASVIPPDHEITVPIKFYDQNNLPVGLDTLKFAIEGTDTRIPFFTSDTILITYPPTYLPMDSVVTMMSYVHEAGTVARAEASIQNLAEVEVGRINLYDDGTHGDTLALDRVFTGQWTADAEGELNTTFIVEDQHGNVGADTNAVSFTVTQRRASQFNLVEPTGLLDTLMVNNATIESDALEAGDQIAVFDDTLCVGSFYFDGTFPVAVQIWYENGEKPGAVADHLMLFKIYDVSEDKLLPGYPVFSKGNGVFGEAETVVDRLNSSLSSAFHLVDPTGRFQTLYVGDASIALNTLSIGDQIGVFDDTLCVGAAIFEGQYPLSVELWLENGGAPGANEGDPIYFKVWDADQADLKIGFPVYGAGTGLFGEDTLFVNDLNSGFAEAVLPVEPTGQFESISLNLATYESQSIEAGDQIAVFDDTLCVGAAFFEGSYPVVIPLWAEHRIQGTDYPGAEAGRVMTYRLWDTDAAKEYIGYPSYAEGDGLFGQDTTVVRRLQSRFHSALTPIEPSGLYHTVYVDMGYYRSDTLNTGDQIAVFDDTLCVGAAIYEGDSPIPITVWLDNGETGSGAGKKAPMLYKLWNKDDDRLLQGHPDYAAGTGLYGEDTTLVARLQSDLSDALSLVNPTGVYQTVYIQKTWYQNQVIDPGDQIAVYDDTLCVGAAIYENVDPLAITVWQQSGELAGGRKDHPFHLKIWNDDVSALLPGFPVYTAGQGVFDEDSTLIGRLQSDLAEPFLQVNPTGLFETITIEEATIARNPLIVGDQIGVFDDTLCVGAAIFDGNYPVSVTLWYENTVDERDYAGAGQGNEMIFEIWDSQFSQNLGASALYTYGQGVFGEDTTAVSRLITDAIALKLNIKPDQINMVAYNLLPDSLEISALFRPLETLEMVRNDVGEHYLPKLNMNTLDNVEFTKGYQVFADLDTNQVLSYIGSALDPTAYSLSLKTDQTRWIGYPYRNSYTVQDVFGGIKSKLQVIGNDDGEFWIPSYNINTMQNLMPGEGYQIAVSQDVDFDYSDLSNALTAGEKDTLTPPVQFEFVKTGLPYPIVITGVDAEMAAGDEIAAFDGMTCVGAVVVTGDYPMVMAGWEGVDAYDIPGFRSGNEIQFQVWRAADSTTFAIEPLFASQASETYNGAAMTVVRLRQILSGVENHVLPMEFALEQNYPNPFNPETSIRYQLPEKADVRLEVYNMLGQQIKQLVDQNKPAGYYTVRWDGTNARGMKVESGMYFLRIHAGNYVKTRKMVLVK